jgi:hypothetical protein
VGFAQKKVGPVGSGASLDLYAGTMLMFLKKKYNVDAIIRGEKSSM